MNDSIEFEKDISRMEYGIYDVRLCIGNRIKRFDQTLKGIRKLTRGLELTNKPVLDCKDQESKICLCLFSLLSFQCSLLATRLLYCAHCLWHVFVRKSYVTIPESQKELCCTMIDWGDGLKERVRRANKCERRTLSWLDVLEWHNSSPLGTNWETSLHRHSPATLHSLTLFSIDSVVKRSRTFHPKKTQLSRCLSVMFSLGVSVGQ